MKTITISGKEFQVSEPYAAGHAITEAEAKALNQVRAENIRNNMASKVKAAQATEGRKEDDPTLDTIADIIAAYDSEYEFTLASVGGGKRPTDPVEIEATKIAKDMFSAWCSSKGFTVKAAKERLGDDVYSAKIAELAERDSTVKEAKRRVKVRTEAAEAALDGLDFGDMGEAPEAESVEA